MYLNKKIPELDAPLEQRMQRVIAFANTHTQKKILIHYYLRCSCLLACHSNMKLFTGYRQEILPERNPESPQTII